MCQALRKEAAKVRRCHGNGMVKEEMSRERDAKRKRHQKKEAAGGRAGKAKGGQGKGGTKCRWQGKAVLRDREDLLGARRQGCQEREMSEEWDDKRQGLRSKDGDAKRKKCQGKKMSRGWGNKERDATRKICQEKGRQEKAVPMYRCVSKIL
jgi:hypothetical protein